MSEVKTYKTNKKVVHSMYANFIFYSFAFCATGVFGYIRFDWNDRASAYAVYLAFAMMLYLHAKNFMNLRSLPTEEFTLYDSYFTYKKNQDAISFNYDDISIIARNADPFKPHTYIEDIKHNKIDINTRMITNWVQMYVDISQQSKNAKAPKLIIPDAFNTNVEKEKYIKSLRDVFHCIKCNEDFFVVQASSNCPQCGGRNPRNMTLKVFKNNIINEIFLFAFYLITGIIVFIGILYLLIVKL